MVGDIKSETITITKGDYWNSQTSNSFRITLRNIIPRKKRSLSPHEFTVEIEITGPFSAIGHAASTGNNTYTLPYIATASIRASAALIYDYIKPDRYIFSKVYVEHVNIHAQVVTLAVVHGSFERPWKWQS